MAVFKCLVLITLSFEVVAISNDIASHHLRQAEKQVATVFQHASGEALPFFEKNDPIIGDSPFNVPERKRRVMDMINKFRAEVCANMKEQHGVKFESFKQCHEFMEEACRPGKDKEMDGDRKEITSGEGYCEEYFPEAEKKAEKAVDDEDKAAAAHGPAPAPGAAPGSAPGPAPSAAKAKEEAAAPAPAAAGKAEAPAAAADGGAAGGVPSPAPGGSPSAPGGPSPGPFTPGISGGKPSGKIPKDEAWYYKKDGKSLKDRMHMDASLGLPAHGYWGKLIEHEDMESSTEDWGKEFTDHDTFDAFCAKHHDNPWCQKHRSKSSGLVASMVVLLACLARMAL